MNKTPKNIFGLFFVFSLILIGSFAFTHSASAATYYVDATNGLDSNPGTEIQPWKTINKVNISMDSPAIIQAGDYIFFKKGETFTGFLDVDVTGTVGNIITFGAYGAGINPIINASGNLHAIDLRNGMEYINIENLDVRNATNEVIFGYNSGAHWNIIDSSATNTQYGAYIYNGTFSDINFINFTANSLTRGLYIYATISSLTITNSTFNNNSGNGVYIGGNIQDVEIDRLTANSNGSTGLLLDTISANNIKIEKSEFIGNINEFNGLGFIGTGNNADIIDTIASNNGGDGFNIHGPWTNITFTNSTAESNGTDGIGADGDGFSFHDTSSGTIENCISKNNLKSAIAQVGSAQVVMNNNLFTHTTNGTIGLVSLQDTGTYTLYNNIIYSVAQVGTGLDIIGPTVIAKNNIIYGFNKGINKTSGQVTEDYNLVYNSVTGWTGLTQGTHSIILNPLFTSSSNFKLLPTSPAINAGTNVSLTSDYLGNPIIGIPDIGAYEFQASTIPTSLSQYKADGTTAITSGTFTNEDSVVLKFNMSSSEYNSSDLLTPQVEIQELDIPFTDTVTNSGDAVAYSGSDVEGVVTVTGLTSGKTYHWQARVSNPATTSAWVSKGGSPDFQVDTTAPLTPIATPSSGTYTSTQTVTLSATGSDSIRYAIDATPTDCSSGTLYTVPISVSTSQTIYVRACDSLNNSSTASFVYIISPVRHTSSGSSVSSRFNNLISMGNLQAAEELRKEFPNQIPNQIIISPLSTPISIIKTLKLTSQRMRGEDVKILQNYLNTKGYDCGIADGIFGPKTKKAVVKFQLANGLKGDGIVGPKTKEMMK